jgi:hypothetical protein
MIGCIISTRIAVARPYAPATSATSALMLRTLMTLPLDPTDVVGRLTNAR